MKKILLASPIRGGASPTYIKNLISILLSRMNRLGGGPNAPYEIQWCATSGTSVAMARDEQAHVALSGGFDRLVFWDIDMGHFDGGVTVSMLARLLSHEVDIVAGQYVGHSFLSQFHGAVAEEGAQPRPDGLLPMAQIPLGFSSISTDALRKIKAAHPHRTYMVKQTCDASAKPGMFEFFPNGVVGPNTAEEKLKRLSDHVENCSSPGGDVDYSSLREIIDADDFSGNYMLGEDFYFCKLAREAGIPLYVDNNLIVPHDTNVRLPVNNETLLQALLEQWRWDDKATSEEIVGMVESLKKMFGPNHA